MVQPHTMTYIVYFNSMNQTHLQTSNTLISHPLDRTSSVAPLFFLVSRGQTALKLRTKMVSVRVQQRRRRMKEGRAMMREAKRHMVPNRPKPNLQRGWTGEEVAAHQSTATRGMRGTVTGRQGRGIRAAGHSGAGGAPVWSSLPCTFYPGLKERSSGGAAAACCPT